MGLGDGGDSAQPEVTLETLHRVVNAAGVAVTIDRLPPDLGSVGRSHVFLVGEFVIKIDQNSNARAEREHAALRALEGSGLPIPRLVATGKLDAHRPWTLMSRLRGTEPSDTQHLAHELSPALAAHLGSLAAALHRAAVSPWGEHQVAPLIERDITHTEAFAAMARRLGYVPENEVEHLVQLMAATRDALTLDPSRYVLIHRDLQPRNLLIDRAGSICGLFDFESAGLGDPLEDFGRVALDWTTPAFSRFCSSYLEGGGALDPGAADRIAHWVLRWVQLIFAYVGPVVPGYVAAARSAVERIENGERPSLPLLETRRSP